jgi:hypothetical protein
MPKSFFGKGMQVVELRRVLREAREAAQAILLAGAGLDVFIAALARSNHRLVRVVDPLAVLEEIF